MYGFYTPDLAMADIEIEDILVVHSKTYDPVRDMMYWEFEKVTKEELNYFQ